MDNKSDTTRYSRRTVLAGAGALAGCSVMSAGGDGSVGDTQAKSALEIENERLVTQFCLDWATKDINLLADYLADDVVYQMFEGRPDIIGREAFIKELGGFLDNLKEVEWEILRTYSIGELVINDRVDHFVGEDEKRSMHFSIAGYFLVRDGKIKVWKDYSLPGGISQVGGAFTGG
jgi:limonene-1,2-epoxide hydrolase